MARLFGKGALALAPEAALAAGVGRDGGACAAAALFPAGGASHADVARMFSTTEATRDTIDCACSTVLPSMFDTLSQILQNVCDLLVAM